VQRACHAIGRLKEPVAFKSLDAVEHLSRNEVVALNDLTVVGQHLKLRRPDLLFAGVVGYGVGQIPVGFAPHDNSLGVAMLEIELPSDRKVTGNRGLLRCRCRRDSAKNGAKNGQRQKRLSQQVSHRKLSHQDYLGGVHSKGILPAQDNRVILSPVRALSNLLSGANASAWVSRPAHASETDDALALVLGSPNSPASMAQIGEFKQFAHQREIDLRELWVFGSGNRLAWAVLPIYSPGRTILLLTPSELPRQGDVSPLVDAVCLAAASRGVHLAQLLADPSDGQLQQTFNRSGFIHIAELLYLQSALRRVPAPPRMAEGLSWQTYSDQSHPLFCRAILRSYIQSLDCPALAGLRDIEDIVAGHRSSGEFDPQYWHVLLDAEEPIGVVLLTRVPRVEMAELVYLGVVPEARGRGIGDVMMKQALWGVSQMGLQRLTVAVDARNAPALKLYFRHGLGHIGSKTALLRDLRVKTQNDSVQPS